jgi:hypothetical protein
MPGTVLLHGNASIGHDHVLAWAGTTARGVWGPFARRCVHVRCALCSMYQMVSCKLEVGSWELGAGSWELQSAEHPR